MHAGSLDITSFFRDYSYTMKKDFISRQQIESMSTQDLIELADDYGIDIPDDLNRCFILGEILDAIEEFSNAREETVAITDDNVSIPDTLPNSYNNTCIDAVLRNPAWAFVYWDLKEHDIKKLKEDISFDGLFIRASFYDNADDDKPEDYFDVHVDFSPKEQYILIPNGKKNVRFDLMANLNEKTEALATSRMISIPSENEKIQKIQPGMKLDFPELVKLSGIDKILHDHYLNHRQSFSE